MPEPLKIKENQKLSRLSESFVNGADNRSPATSPYGLALQVSREPIPQARFDHRLLERSPDVLAYADAFSGSSPDSIV